MTPRPVCASCRHYDPDHGSLRVPVGNMPQGELGFVFIGYGFCTNPQSWHAHKAMPPDEGCQRWAEKDEEAA